jgi:hypothetical protein
MPGSSAAKAKNKVLYVADAVVEIIGGVPDEDVVHIKPRGTVQFVNKDEVNWRVRLLTRENEEHADVDLFLAARSSCTVIGPDEGECKYEVHEVTSLASNKVDAASTGKRNGGGAIAAGGGATGGATANATRAGGGGGGTIKIGP